MSRKLPILPLLLAAACQLPSEQPPATAEHAPSEAPSHPAPLPPEETPPEPAPDPAAPAEAQPIEPGITTTSGAPKRGTLPKAVIDEKLKSVQPSIQACYERALKTAPELRGTVNVNFVVGEDGKVAHAEAIEVDGAVSDAATVECIVGEIKKLQFPEPSGGRVFLDYPLKLEPPAPAAAPAK